MYFQDEDGHKFLKEAGDSQPFNGPQPSQSSCPTTNFMYVHVRVMTAALHVCVFVSFICAALRPDPASDLWVQLAWMDHFWSYSVASSR